MSMRHQRLHKSIKPQHLHPPRTLYTTPNKTTTTHNSLLIRYELLQERKSKHLYSDPLPNRPIPFRSAGRGDRRWSRPIGLSHGSVCGGRGRWGRGSFLTWRCRGDRVGGVGNDADLLSSEILMANGRFSPCERF